MDMASSNKLSYPQRLFVWLLGYSLLMVGCFVAFQYAREKKFKEIEINAILQTINSYILSELKDGHRASEIRTDEFKPFDNIRISVIDDKGNVVYDNTLDSLPHTNHLDRLEIKQAIQSGTGYAVRRHSESTGNNYFYSAQKSPEGYIVRSAVSYSLSLSELLKADFGFLWVMGGIAIVMCILGYFATRRVGLLISRLNNFAENVEKGMRISDTEPFPHDELGEISNHIVRLYAKLQQAYSDRDRQHRAAIHEQLEKERIKKQLTNNINHELKTPVASIRISLETLMAHKNLSHEKKTLFLQRCFSNVERLQRLLSDVALVTRMDDGQKSIEKEPVDLVGIIADVVADRLPIAEAKGFIIDNRLTGNLTIPGNISLLETVFNNLIDNAIAYSGGTSISIELIDENEDEVQIAFSDNGCGVADEHLPRLFERFYRIDKGRSRAAGGTGLGLSIVKNAVAIHGGNILAETRPTGGLSFSISFSKY